MTKKLDCSASSLQVRLLLGNTQQPGRLCHIYFYLSSYVKSHESTEPLAAAL